MWPDALYTATIFGINQSKGLVAVSSSYYNILAVVPVVFYHIWAVVPGTATIYGWWFRPFPIL